MVLNKRVAQTRCICESAPLYLINIHILLMHQNGTGCLHAKPCPSEGPQSLNGGDSALPTLSYAAGQPNVLSGVGLLNPFKSSAFRNLMGLSEKIADAAPEVNVVYATGHAVIGTSVAAYAGGCH